MCVSWILIVSVVGIQRGAVVPIHVVVSMVCSVLVKVSMVCSVVVKVSMVCGVVVIVIPASICHVCFSIFENFSY